MMWRSGQRAECRSFTLEAIAMPLDAELTDIQLMHLRLRLWAPLNRALHPIIVEDSRRAVPGCGKGPHDPARAVGKTYSVFQTWLAMQ